MTQHHLRLRYLRAFLLGCAVSTLNIWLIYWTTHGHPLPMVAQCH